MHPAIALMLRNPQNRATAAHILARQGNHGDTMLAHIDPREAMVLKQMGGVGTVNPKTGLRQFWEDGGGAGNSAGADSGNQGDGNGGGNNGGNSNGGDGSNQGSGGYTGTHASGPGFGSGPVNSPSGGYGQYGSDGGYNGGVTVNPGRSLVSLGLNAIPGVGPILGGLNSIFGPRIGPSLNIGGTTNGYAIDGGKTGVYGLGGSGQGHVGAPGANGGGQHDGGGWGAGNGPGGPGAPGATPAPATPPAGLPPAVLQALAGMYAQGPQSDPFGRRFGKMPVTSPYLVAANQPQAPGYLTGLIN